MKHQSPELPRHTRPTGTLVTIRARDDLDPSSDTVKVQHSGRSLTSVPENVGLCQVVALGPDVTNVQAGDICFIDFFDVAQGYLVEKEELYITQASALRMTLDIETAPWLNDAGQDTGKLRVLRCDVTPLPGYCLTKHAAERMTVAVTGSDRMILPRHVTTGGIVGQRDQDGNPNFHVCYEELVKFTPGFVQAERDSTFTERRLEAKIERLEKALAQQLAEDDQSVDFADWLDRWGIAPGDLVTFPAEYSIQFRAMGELYRCVAYEKLLATIDDRAILADFNAQNPLPPLVQLMGGGAERLYGT
jgi:hypothetical protein